jgi:hypothetical protein
MLNTMAGGYQNQQNYDAWLKRNQTPATGYTNNWYPK